MPIDIVHLGKYEFGTLYAEVEVSEFRIGTGEKLVLPSRFRFYFMPFPNKSPRCSRWGSFSLTSGALNLPAAIRYIKGIVEAAEAEYSVSRTSEK